ncbi:hypothetical protein [Actinacidiphila acidipaludis]|uniref:Uncharacterized protein n=1 Tax=Actinacidiphila acidipaludis TaxID=2873382 RepID=A0ABS7PZ53_9ACTN|nr:hypothetical protein [Streptomyces acidipaludis]MBY8876148.1 hypothetical protein [Streptomyces acidipaludis]
MSASVLRRRRAALRVMAGSVALVGALGVPAAAAYADQGATPAPSASDKGGAGQGQVTPAGVLVHTDALMGGLTAKVYRFGTATPYYSADITKSGKVRGSLTAGFGHASSQTRVFDDVSVTLYGDGRVTSAADKGGSGQGPVTDTRCTVTHRQNIGAGTAALMTISPTGPSVLFQAAGEKGVIPGLSLDRHHPKLPAGHFTAEILRPDSSRPQLLTNMEGGGHKATVTDFPRLPQGCHFDYSTTDGTSGTGTPTTAAPAATQQTNVVPKGSVAAGYQAPDNGGHQTLLAVGGSAAALGAAGIAFVAVRRRRATAGR